jgi:hypothetical protein
VNQTDPADDHHLPATRTHSVLFVLAGLLIFLPPEARGESMAGSALLILLFVVLAVRRPLPAWMIWPPLLGVGLIFPSFLLAQAAGTVVEPISMWVLAAALGLAVASVRAPANELDRLPVVLAVAASVVALYGLYQLFWGLDRIVATIESGVPLTDATLVAARARSGRAFAGFPTPAALGGLLILTLPLTLGAAIERRGARRRILILLAAIQCAGLLATVSVTAAAGLSAALIVWGLIRVRRIAPRALVPATAALIVLAVIVTLRGPEVTDLGATDNPVRLRAGNFRVAGEMIADHPWIGVGAGGFGESYPQYRRVGDNESRHVHDLPLELCVDWGVPLGIVFSLVLAFVFIGPLFRRRGRKQPPWVRGATVGLAALALQNLLDFTLLLPSLLWLAMIVRGSIAARSASAQPTSSVPARWAMACAVALAATVVLLGGLAWNARVAARQALVQGDTDAALVQSVRATRLAPWNADGWLYRAQLAIEGTTGGSCDADCSIDHAVRLARVRPSIRMTRARIRASEGDLPGAYTDAARAARLYPYRGEYARSRDEIATLLQRAFRSSLSE